MASRVDSDAPPAKRLETLAREAVSVAKKAKKHKQNLGGTGFYAGKLANLPISATNAFTDLTSASAGDTSALAELITAVFSPSTAMKERHRACQEITFALRTTWRDGTHHQATKITDGIFPSTLLDQTKRGYLIKIGRQMNGCFQYELYDAAAVMMRRLLEISIIEAFEAKGLENKIKNAGGDYLQLSDLIARALAEPAFNLSRNTKKALPKLRDAGHFSAHGRSYFAQMMDIERIQPDFRVALEHFLHLSGRL